MLREKQLKNFGLVFVIIFILCFVIFKYYFTNNLILSGDEVTYHAMALDTLNHQEHRFIDPSEFPGTKFSPRVYLIVSIISTISAVTGILPFYVIKFFIPLILFILSLTFFYILSRKIIKDKYFSILLTILLFAALFYKRGSYSINAWFLSTGPQTISYVYFLIVNFLIFGTGLLKKKISKYDFVIIAIILSWAHLHLTYLVFGLAYYLFTYLFRCNFFYPKKCIYFCKKNKYLFLLFSSIIVCLSLKLFYTVKAYMDVGLDTSIKIPYSFTMGTVGKHLFAIFLLLMIYKILKINYRTLSESLLFLLLGFSFIFLIFLNPLYFRWIPVNNLYYRFIGYFIVFLYLSLVMFMGMVFKQNKRFALTLVFFLVLLSIPQLKPYKVYEDLEYNLIVIHKEKELFGILKQLPRNSVFIESSVSPYIILSSGFPIASVPCWLDYLNNQDIKKAGERLKRLENKRFAVYASASEKYFYDNVREAIEQCYKYQIGPGLTYKQQSDLFYNSITPIEKIPYDFYYVQSKKRLEQFYLEQYKNNNYPLSELDLLKYIHSPDIKGEYFEEYYGNDEFTVWRLKKIDPFQILRSSNVDLLSPAKSLRMGLRAG